MIATLLGWGLSQRAAKLIAYVGAPLLVLAILGGGLWWLRHDAYYDGVRAERAAWEQKAAKLEAEAQRVQRQADQVRSAAETLQRAKIASNRQEVDNAVRNIPDQGTSPRQHARACLELRRQGQNPAACQPPPAG